MTTYRKGLRKIFKFIFIGLLISFGAIVIASSHMPAGIHLGWSTDDVNHTMTVTWYTETLTPGTKVLYDEMSHGGDYTAYTTATVSKEPVPIIGDGDTLEGYTYSAELNMLKPGNTYYFVCGSDEGFSDEFMFRTLPEDPEMLTFIVGGDTRQGAQDFPYGRNEISKLMVKHNPYFVLHVGDFIERAFDANEWKEYTNHLQETWITENGYMIPIVTMLGNHEVGRTEPAEYYEVEIVPEDARLYYAFFSQPEPRRWFELTFTPYFRFFSANSETFTVKESQHYFWLDQALNNSMDFTWKIVGYHTPAIVFSDYVELTRSGNFLPLFDKYHVDMAVCGHEHFYARTPPMNVTKSGGSYYDFKDGTVHLLSGGWGAPLSQADPRWWHAAGPVSEYSYTVFEISKDALRVRAIDINDNLIDDFTISKDTAVAGSQIIARTRGDSSYAADNTGPAPLITYDEGTYPPIVSIDKVGFGTVVAAGLAWNMDEQWKTGEMDVLFDILFQQMVPGAMKVLWYEGYGVEHNTTKDASFVSALEALGYTVVGDNTEPITADLLDGYDIVVIPQLRLGSAYEGGNPDLLPWEDVEALKEFVTGGKGLMVMDAHDYGGNNWALVQNKILEGVGANIALQSDGVYDWLDNWNRGWFPMGTVDPSTEIGAAYLQRTGGSDLAMWEVSTVAPVSNIYLAKIAANEETIVDARKVGADARVMITAEEEGYVRVQKIPGEEGILNQIDITTDIPEDKIHWPITIELYYTEDAFANFNLASEDLLDLYYWDSDQRMWRRCTEVGVNPGRNVVTSSMYHLTRFAIMPVK